MIGYIVKLFKSLNANANPAEIAHAFSIGFLLGILPKNNLLWYLLFVFFLFVRINKGAYFLIMILFSCIAPLFDPLFNTTGYTVLEFTPLTPAFSTLIDIPFAGFTRFNNTVVMGSLVSGLALYIPLYILGRLFVKAWRASIASKLRTCKLVTAFYKLPLVNKIQAIASEID